MHKYTRAYNLLKSQIINMNINKLYISIFLFLIIFLFCWWSNPALMPKINLGDTPGYLSVAKDFSATQTEIRPFFFPLIIRICMNISELHWERILSIFQISLHSLVCVVIFHFYSKHNFNCIISIILTLLIGFNPSLIYWSTYLMPDFLLAVLTTLAWIFFVIFIHQFDKNNKINIFLVFSGIFCGLAIVTKPTSMLSIVPFLFTFIIISKNSLNMLKAIILIIIINFSFHVSWERYKEYYNPTSTFELLDFIEYSVNMTAIRGGLVDYGIGTPLYDEIKKKELLESAREFRIKISYTMDGNPEYWKFNKSLSWEIKNDKEFAKKILYKAPLKLFICSISNWHAFFTKRCFGPGEGSFPYMPEIIRNFYTVGYALLYRPSLAIMLLISFIILWRKHFFILLISSGGILLYASLSIALLTPHGGEFARYRVWIEYIMWFCALFPIGYLFSNVINRSKKL